MRTKEQFKKYVYEKADKKASFLKKSRAVWVRGVAAFSLLFIISGALIYGDFASKDSTSGNLAKEESVIDGSRGDSKTNGTYFYSKSMDDVIQTIEMETVNECGYGTVITQPFSLSEDMVDVEQEKNLCIQYCADGKRIDSEEAVAIAKEKCTISYNQINVYYDSEADVWKVVFSTENTVGGCQTVYLNGDGTVRSIGYGE